MLRWPMLLRNCAFIFLCGALFGCLPSQDKADEQKDPHYLNGRARSASLDYAGAIEEFEKALETNPRSASAHLELALLYEEQMKDFAAAIYHYEQHLKLRQNSEYAERARERIKACKMDLVKTEVLGPVSQSMQRELERLTTENMLLKQRIEVLEAQLNGRPAPKNPAAPDNQLPQDLKPTPLSVSTKTTAKVSEPAPRTLQKTKNESAPTKTSRTYTVKSGDKLTVIAKQFGVQLTELMQANPGVDPTRLKIGQSLNIP